MANRTLRRTRKPTASVGTNDGESTVTIPVERTVPGNGDGDGLPSATESDVDGLADGDAATVDEPARNGVVEIDPEQLDAFIASGGHRTDGGTDSGEPRQRRRRTDAGTTRGRRTGKATPPQDITPLLNMVHVWAPVMLNIPELAIAPEDLKTLSDAYIEFCKHHAVPEVTEKRLSEVNLIIALGMTYGTRAIAYMNRKKQERKTAQPNNVAQMPQPQTRAM